MGGSGNPGIQAPRLRRVNEMDQLKPGGCRVRDAVGARATLRTRRGRRRQKEAIIQERTAQPGRTAESDANTVEHRLTELEVKLAFTEDLVDRLNETVFRQQEQIDLLLRELVALRQQLRDAGEGGAFRSLRDELPPHY
jgi:SlyX protein